MANMVTAQELENAKIDARTIGESVNENKIVTPRYGAPFKSMPMIAEEMQSVIGAIIGGGVPANIVLDVSGKTQQELNNDFNSLTKTTAQKFTDFTTAIDAATLIQNYANNLSDGDTLLIPKGKWAIKSACVINKAINIKCDGELVVSGDFSSVFKLSRDPVYTLTGTDLTQLPKKGDTKLYMANTALFDSAEHYFALNSSEVEIVRIGYADPYYKNETLDFIDSAFTLRGQVDLDYTDASKLTIKVFKKTKPTSVQLRMSLQPNAGQTTGARILETEGVSNILWDIDIDRTSSKLVAGTSFKYKNCVHFSFAPTCRILGGQSDASDSYAFLNECSSYVIHMGGNYSDMGVSTKKERGYSGRHGKYVFFQSCFLNGIDDHWGHWYTIKDMTFVNRGIVIAGGSVHVENVYNLGEAFLMQNRLDTPYNDGRLALINCHARSGLLIAEATNNASYNSKYKHWDEIHIERCSSYSALGYTHAIRFSNFFAQNTNTTTKKLTIRDFAFKRVANTIGKWLQCGTGTHFDEVETKNIGYETEGTETAFNQMATGITAGKKITIDNMQSIDGNWIAPIINIKNDSKLGYNVATPILLLASTRMVLNSIDISDDVSSYGSALNQGSIYINLCRITGSKFFENSNLRNAIESASGNSMASGVVVNFDGDLRNYQKTKPMRYLSSSFALGTLAVGAVSAVQTVAVVGARVGDPVDYAFTTNANGLRCNSWVSANDTVKYYIENPAGNPNGSQTFASIGIRFSVRSN